MLHLSKEMVMMSVAVLQRNWVHLNTLTVLMYSSSGMTFPNAGGGVIAMHDELRKLDEVINIFQREVASDVALSQLKLFVTIAQEEGVTQHELTERLQLNPGTISRNLRMLSKFAEPGAGGTKVLKGYDLVDQHPDIYERRRLACHLTIKGHQLKEKILSAMACDGKKKEG
jgi:DNA-binding MarR family transcriptional regulator